MLPLRQRWCLAIGAPIVARAGLDPASLGGWAPDHIARARGEYEIFMAAVDTLKRAFGIASRDELMAWARPRLHDKRELAQVVAAFSIATVAQYLSEHDAWQAILLAGKLAQTTYRSWDNFAATCEPVPDVVRAAWAELPWTTELGVTIFEEAARVRFLRSTCPSCGAPRTRPSPTAYVYCDHCGQLADYDFARACERPLERPGPSPESIDSGPQRSKDRNHPAGRVPLGGPAYEAIRATLADELAAARDDLDAYRAVQVKLYTAWVEACPGATPVRIKDPAYRAAYIALFAEAETRAAFNAEARDRLAAMEATVGKLGLASVDGRARVLPEPYRAMEAAMFAHEARRHELALAHGLYEQHPDHAPPELIRRIGFSMFAQGWLPYLDEADARALLARTGLHREYAIAEPPETHPVACTTCGGPLDIVTGAKRVVCDHCGRLIDVIGR